MKCTFVPEEDPLQGGMNACVSIGGNDASGEGCRVLESGRDTCGEGLFCVTGEENPAQGTVAAGGLEPLEGICAPFCEAEGTCPTGAVCIVEGEGKLPLCFDECDPLDANCSNDWVCFDDVGTAAWYCRPRLPGQTGGHGSSCDMFDLRLCAPGFVCLPPSSVDDDECTASIEPGCCAQLCDLDDLDLPCPGGLEECLPLEEGAPLPGLEHLGACAVPMD